MIWSPIDTAPKDGTPILVYGKRDLHLNGGTGVDAWLTAKWEEWKGVADWRWLEGADREDDNRLLFEPTHWTQLSKPL